MSDATLAEVIAAHRLHASMNVCSARDWRAVEDGGSIANKHAEHLAQVVLDHLREIAGRAEVVMAMVEAADDEAEMSLRMARRISDAAVGAFLGCVR